MLCGVGLAGEVGTALEAELFPPQVVDALGEIHTSSTLFRVDAAVGGSAAEAVSLCSPGGVRTCL